MSAQTNLSVPLPKEWRSPARPSTPYTRGPKISHRYVTNHERQVNGEISRKRAISPTVVSEGENPHGPEIS